MKKLILLLLLLPTITVAQTTIKHIEINAGISTGTVPLFPGASVLFGKTKKYESGLLLDYQGGVAFPTLVTGKVGVGYDFKSVQVCVGVRPWPPTTYTQVIISRPNKLSDITVSAEGMLFPNDAIQRAIITLGWRFNFMSYKQIKKLNAR